MIIFRLLLGLLANGVAAIPELPHLEILDKSSVVKRQENLASAFREHLTYTPNSNRRTFYERVTAKAKQVSFLSILVFMRMMVFSSLWKNATFWRRVKHFRMVGTL